MFGLKILGLFLIITGALVTFGASRLVDKFGLNQKAKCDFKEELTEEELKEYQYNKALVNTKMMGMLILLPGIVLVYFSFR